MHACQDNCKGLNALIADLVDVEAHCCGGADADIQDEWMALGLKIMEQLLTQLPTWLLQ